VSSVHSRYVTLAVAPTESHYEVLVAKSMDSMETSHAAVMSHHIISKLCYSVVVIVACDLLNRVSCNEIHHFSQLTNFEIK